MINYFYVSLAMNMIKILRNLHSNDVLKRHLTFLTFCMKKCFILSTDWFSDSVIERKTFFFVSVEHSDKDTPSCSSYALTYCQEHAR